MIETRRFPPLLAAAALLILFHQAVDLATLLPATDLGTPAGRAGQLLATQARTPAILSADLLLIWALLAGGFPRALRVVAGLHLGVGALLLVLVPWFLVDAGKLAVGFAGSESPSFRIVVARALVLLLLTGIGALIAGRVLFSAARETRPGPA